MIKKHLVTVTTTAILALLLTACGSSKNDAEPQQTNPQQMPQSTNEAIVSTQQPESLKSDRKIKDQSFEIMLPIIGQAEFISYAPDLALSAEADATFEIVKDGATIQELEGISTTNTRSTVTFNKVEAVSFKDYNTDGNRDIIVICSYKKSQRSFSEARVYKGDSKGKFTLEKQLTDDANAALVEVTVKSVLDFLGADKTNQDMEWKQAYIDVVNRDKETTPWEGYSLIYLNNDEVPELVKIGSFEAMGCMIVNYSDGKTRETQLNRLNFTYIPKKNLLCNSDGRMDCYYDLVFSIKNGKMKLIDAGYFGAKDNTDVKFDKDGNPIYEYKWNDEVVSKKEYTKKLNAVYNLKQAKPGYEDGKYFDAAGIIKEINKF